MKLKTEDISYFFLFVLLPKVKQTSIKSLNDSIKVRPVLILSPFALEIKSCATWGEKLLSTIQLSHLPHPFSPKIPYYRIAYIDTGTHIHRSHFVDSLLVPTDHTTPWCPSMHSACRCPLTASCHQWLLTAGIHRYPVPTSACHLVSAVQYQQCPLVPDACSAQQSPPVSSDAQCPQIFFNFYSSNDRYIQLVS